MCKAPSTKGVGAQAQLGSVSATVRPLITNREGIREFICERFLKRKALLCKSFKWVHVSVGRKRKSVARSQLVLLKVPSCFLRQMHTKGGDRRMQLLPPLVLTDQLVKENLHSTGLI